MPGLPDRPDLDQLRRQARELLRAAVGRDPAAVARIRAVSERMTLSAAQLALAREYGCRTWAALRAEVERRRSPLDRWSFGGAAAIETPSGLLLPEGLIVGADDAVLSTTLTPLQHDAGPDRAAPAESHASINEEIRALEASTQIGDIAVVDDRGAAYALSVRAMSGAHGPSPASISFRVDPPPQRGIGWIELGGQDGTTARLLPSPRAAVRLGPRTPVTSSPRTPVTASPLTGQRSDDGLPPGGGAPAEAADRTDGPRHHLDLGITLPPIDGMVLQLDSLISAPGGWYLFLRASPRWWRYRDDRRRKWSPVTISAEDDQGCSYQYSFGGSAGRDGHQELSLRFGPRLDPLARRLRLTCTGSAEQIVVDLDLAD
jgi:hypothetical protein